MYSYYSLEEKVWEWNVTGGGSKEVWDKRNPERGGRTAKMRDFCPAMKAFKTIKMNNLNRDQGL